MHESISACITAGNEERNIRRCLESLTWANEIIVVDSFSTDRTVEISKEYTDRVYQHEWLGYIGQKNLIRGMASGPWLLFLDADEEISPELRDQILHEFKSGAQADYAGYEFARKVWYLGKWITHGDWYPDRKLRLFRKEKGRSAGIEPHDLVEVDGKVKRLRGDLNHYSYDGIKDQLAAIDRFSTITARGWYEEGKPFRWRHLLCRPLLRFMRSYIMRMGFLDGFAGLVIATTASYGVFVKYAKLHEFSRVAEHKP